MEFVKEPWVRLFPHKGQIRETFFASFCFILFSVHAGLRIQVFYSTYMDMDTIFIFIDPVLDPDTGSRS